MKEEEAVGVEAVGGELGDHIPKTILTQKGWRGKLDSFKKEGGEEGQWEKGDSSVCSSGLYM